MLRAIQACLLLGSLCAPSMAQEDVWRNFSGIYQPPVREKDEEALLTVARKQSIAALLKRGKPPWVCEPSDDWTKDLRCRLVRLSASVRAILAEAGPGCARGGQGSNGAMWLIRFGQSTPILLAGPEQGFEGFLFSIEPPAANGYRDVVVGWHRSAGETGVSRFRFDGVRYRLIGRARIKDDDDGHPRVIPD